MRSRSVRWWAGATCAVLAVAVVAVVAVQGGSGGTPSTVPHFVDETASAGVDHAYEGTFQFFVGGGVATFDCDDDGFPDLYLAGGSEPAGLYRNVSAPEGALKFEQIQSPVTDLPDVTGAYPIDIDSDGHLDLVVLRVGENVVLRGDGRCGFERANEALGLDGGNTWTTAFSATWEGSNALPTLAFGNYLTDDRQGCADSELVRPEPGGATYAEPMPLSPGLCTLSVLFSDWHRTGQRDLRMTNDRHYYRDGSDQLWKVRPDEPPRLYTEADGWNPLKIWGMGIASEDITGDGMPEVFLTSQSDNKLQTLAEGAVGPTYVDIALARGALAQSPFTGGDVLPSTAWHPEFVDINNDGFTDLFITKGNVDSQPDYATKDPDNLMLGGRDGTFTEVADQAGILNYDPSRGASLVDLNQDGMLDLVVVNRAMPVSVWRDVGHGDGEQPEPIGNWIEVRPHQPAPNTDAIGAWIEVRFDDHTVEREVTVGGGHVSGELGWLHFGLGSADEVEVRVQWPDGDTGGWTTVRAGERTVLER